MNDDKTPPTTPSTPGDAPRGSGNRWEPAAGRPAVDETAPLAGQPVTSPEPAAPPYAAGPVADPARPSWRDRLRPNRLGPRARTGVAAGAAALVVGGVGGFAIGHATASDGHSGLDGQGFGGQPFDGRGSDGHDHGGVPPQGQLPGQLPGQQGQLPRQSGGSSGELPEEPGTNS
jgi:hypothetical protein